MDAGGFQRVQDGQVIHSGRQQIARHRRDAMFLKALVKIWFNLENAL